jgi:hypothetical protein
LTTIIQEKTAPETSSPALFFSTSTALPVDCIVSRDEKFIKISNDVKVVKPDELLAIIQ